MKEIALQHYHKEHLGKIYGPDASAELWRFCLDDIMHPERKDMLKVCLITTKTCIGNIDGIDAILTEVIRDIDADIIVAPEYTYTTDINKNKPLSEKEKDKFLEKIIKETDGKNKLVIPGTFVWIEENKYLKNATYLLYNGELIGRYDKMRDGGESFYARKYNLLFARGHDLGLFTWQGLKIGIEICADWGILEQKGVQNRDLLFLIACGLNQNITPSVLRTGGYGFLNDGNPNYPQHSIYYRTGKEKFDRLGNLI